MRRDIEQLIKPQRLVLVIHNLVPRDRVRQLRDEVEVRLLGGDGEGAVAGARAGAHGEGREGRQREGGRVGLEDAHEVGAQVWHEHEGCGGVEQGLVRVRRVLALRVGAWGREREGFVLY